MMFLFKFVKSFILNTNPGHEFMLLEYLVTAGSSSYFLHNMQRVPSLFNCLFLTPPIVSFLVSCDRARGWLKVKAPY